MDLGFDADIHNAAITLAGVEGGLTGLIEYVAFGLPFLPVLQAFERNFIPRPFRDSPFADAFVQQTLTCSVQFAQLAAGQIGFEDLLEPCAETFPLVAAGCAQDSVVAACFLSEPKSKGSVAINPDGSLSVELNYLSDLEELDAFGKAVRTGYEILAGIQGTSSLQQPCADHEDLACVQGSCPDLLYASTLATLDVLAAFDPVQPGAAAAAAELKAAISLTDPSTISPSFESSDFNQPSHSNKHLCCPIKSCTSLMRRRNKQFEYATVQKLPISV